MKRLLSVLLILCAAAAGQTLEPAADTEKPGTVTGRIVNSVTKEPVRRAEVSLNPIVRGDALARRRPMSASTDDDGRYWLRNVEPGVYELDAQKNGFVRSPESQRPRTARLAVVAGQITRADVELIPHGVITGRIVDEEGEPVAHAQVSILRSVRRGKRRTLVPHEHSHYPTNDLGEYRIAGLPPGRYYVAVHYRPALNTGEGAGLSYRPSYFPGVTDQASAVLLEVGPGEEISASLQLLPVRVYSIKGRIVDSSSKETEAGTISVIATPEDEYFSMMGRGESAVAQDGRFELHGLAPGRYSVTALAHIFHPGQTRPSYRGGAAQVVVEESDVSNVMITITPGTKIRGRVSGEGIPRGKFHQLSIELKPIETDSWYLAMYARPLTQVRDDGTFELPEVSPGAYRVLIYTHTQGWQEHFPQAVRSGSRDALHLPLTVSEGAQPILEIVLAPGAGRVIGVAKDKDGNPHVGASIIGVPQGQLQGRRDATVRSVSDQLGRFELRGAWPGQYTVFALEGDGEYFIDDPKWVDEHLPFGKVVHVTARNVSAVDVQVIPVEEEEKVE